MFDNLFGAMASILGSPVVVLAVIAGAAIGVIAGAIPGLTSAGTIAIIVPITFGMDPLTALALLSAVYTGAQYGGSITATLINTPGTPEAAVMTLDGYAMTRQGRASEALWGALIAGLIGGLISTVILVFAAEPLAGEALNFGPAEYFMLTLFGLSVLASLAEGSVLKGFIVTILGLSLAVIGLDPITGQERFTFGVPALVDGVPQIPVLIGLFALSEGLILMRSREDASPEIPMVKLFSSFPRGGALGRIVRFSLLGTVVGMIVGIKPGGGATVASVLSYSAARQVSSRPQEFGRGAIEGLVAPEAADKATVGAALIPLLVLGLPASASTAVLIGAFTIQGIVPGPTLLKDAGPLVYGLMASILIANVFVFVFGLFGMKPLTRIGRIPPRRLGVIIVVTALVGSYVAQRNMTGIWFALVAGLAGYALKRYRFPVAPLILSLILAPLLESNLRRALVISNGDATTFVTRPISVFLLALTIASLALPVFLRLRKNANKLPTSVALAAGKQSEEGEEDDDSRRGASSP